MRHAATHVNEHGLFGPASFIPSTRVPGPWFHTSSLNPFWQAVQKKQKQIVHLLLIAASASI